MFKHKILALFFVALMFIMAGCFGRGETEEEPGPETSQVAAATDTPLPAATEAPAADAAADSGEPALASADMPTFTTVEEAAEIQRYRMRITMNSTSARGTDQVEILGEYVKEPPAERLTMQFNQNGEVQLMEMMLVDGVRYVQAEGMWMAAPDVAPNIQELTLLTPRDLQEVNNGLVQVGVENVNGRQTVHYRGDKDTIPLVGTESDSLDVRQAEDAQIDLWVEQAAHFLVKMQLTVKGEANDPASAYAMTFEYYDFDADIAIEKPENALSVPGMGQPAGGEQTAGEQPAQEGASTSPLGQLLGFDLMLPTDSTFLLMGSNVAQVTIPYTAEEAVNLFSQTMPANGYSLMSQLNPEAGQTVLMYQKGVKIITINITATDGGSEMQVISAP